MQRGAFLTITDLLGNDRGQPRRRGPAQRRGPRHGARSRRALRGDSETSIRQPTGQCHFFATDADVVQVSHPGIRPITEPRLVEIDIDYNIIHDSNPICTYSGSMSGLQRWEADWSGAGVGGDAELGYSTTGC